MPLPATHLYYSTKIIGNRLDDNNKADFLVGSIIPDVHYLNSARGKNHFNISNKKELIKKLNCLQKTDKKFYKTGIMIHSFIDQWWRDQIYIKSDSPYIRIIIQLVEEEIIFKMLDRANSIKSIEKFLSKEKSYLEGDVAFFLLEIIKYLKNKKWNINCLIKLFAPSKNLTNKDALSLKKDFNIIKNEKELLNQLDKIKHNMNFSDK